MERLQLRRYQIPRYRRADTHLVAAEDRPLDAAYDRFAHLVKLFAERDYDEVRIREDCPFLVQDVLFNSLLCQADRDLAEIARVLGEDPSPSKERAEQTAGAMNEKLWDEEHATGRSRSRPTSRNRKTSRTSSGGPCESSGASTSWSTTQASSKMPFLETSLEVWEEVIAVNLTGPWLGYQEAARQLVAQGGAGRIINVSSVHEDLPMPTNSPYCAAKGGLRMLAHTIAVELAPHGISPLTT